jgi:hypothetical protein
MADESAIARSVVRPLFVHMAEQAHGAKSAMENPYAPTARINMFAECVEVELSAYITDERHNVMNARVLPYANTVAKSTNAKTVDYCPASTIYKRISAKNATDVANMTGKRMIAFHVVEPVLAKNMDF